MKQYLFPALFILGIIGLLVILVGLGSKSTIKVAPPDDPNRPMAQITETKFDLGKMNVNETREHDFEIENIGKSDLTVAKVSTSCDCTFAYIVQGDKKSPKFSMAGNISDWQTTIKAGEKAILKVVYEPAIMPVQGKVVRTVSFATNDPANTNMQVQVSAEVAR